MTPAYWYSWSYTVFSHYLLLINETWQRYWNVTTVIMMYVNSILLTNVFLFSSVQLLGHVWLFATLWTAACQASLSIANSQSLPKLMSIESVMLSNHLILCHPLILLPSIFPSIRVFSNESALCIRWPKYWSFSFNISPSNEHLGLISFKGLSKVFSNTTVQKHQFFSTQLCL